MPGELEKICGLLEKGSAELQCAAAMILGALRPQEPAARKSLVRALKSPNESVRLYALEALARIDPKEALPRLVPLLAGPEPGRGRVVQILTSLGPEGARALRDELDEKDPQVRRTALEALGRMREVDTTDALFDGLLDPDLEVIRQAAQAFIGRVEALPAAERGKVLRKVLTFLESGRVRKLKTPIASCLRIVGALRDGAAAKPLLAYLDRKQPPAARTAALLALAQVPLEGPAARDAARKVLPLLDEDDFAGVVRPALEMLARVPVEPKEADRILELLRSPQPQVREFAIRALGGSATPRSAEALVEVLQGDDPHLAELAAGALRSAPGNVPLLVKALERPGDPAKAFKIANVLRAAGAPLGKDAVRKLLSACLALAAERQPRAQVYFEVLRSAAPDALREAILKKGRDLLAKKRAEDAERFLKLLEREDLSTPEGDLALALARLRLQRKDLTQAGRDRGPAVLLFAKLARQEGFPLVKRLEKDAKLLSAMDLLYLGFAFVERQGPERDLGAEVLRLVARKHKSSGEAKSARQKLRTQGAG